MKMRSGRWSRSDSVRGRGFYAKCREKHRQQDFNFSKILLLGKKPQQKKGPKNHLVGERERACESINNKANG